MKDSLTVNGSWYNRSRLEPKRTAHGMTQKPPKRGFVQNSKGYFWSVGFLVLCIALESLWLALSGKAPCWFLIAGFIGLLIGAAYDGFPGRPRGPVGLIQKRDTRANHGCH